MLMLSNFAFIIFFLFTLDYGTKTCAGYPGSIDHVQQDMQVSISISA